MKYSLMEHERMRWKTMTDKQLITRLNKITQAEKLECFARLCYEHTDRQYLLGYVERRQRELREGIVKEYLTPARPDVANAKAAFYKKVTGRDYSPPKAIEKGVLNKEEKKILEKVKQFGKTIKKEDCGERYLDF